MQWLPPRWPEDENGPEEKLNDVHLLIVWYESYDLGLPDLGVLVLAQVDDTGGLGTNGLQGRDKYLHRTVKLENVILFENFKES